MAWVLDYENDCTSKSSLGLYNNASLGSPSDTTNTQLQHPRHQSLVEALNEGSINYFRFWTKRAPNDLYVGTNVIPSGTWTNSGAAFKSSSHMYGRWTWKQRISGGVTSHYVKTVALLWPTPDVWPPELDLLETFGDSSYWSKTKMTYNVHYGTVVAGHHPQSSFTLPVLDWTLWHDIEFVWTATQMTLSIDGTAAVIITDTAKIPDIAMFFAVQTALTNQRDISGRTAGYVDVSSLKHYYADATVVDPTDPPTDPVTPDPLDPNPGGGTDSGDSVHVATDATGTVPCNYAVIRVYDHDGVTMRDELKATGVSWSDELGQEGSANMTVSMLQKAIELNPVLLKDAIVKIATPLVAGETPTEVFAWIANPGSGTLINDTLSAAHVDVPVSKGIMSIFNEWVLLHEGGLRQLGAKLRYIGWMSAIGSWYQAEDWQPPLLVARWDSNLTPERTNQPKNWPDPAACWITRSDYSSGAYSLFRKVFTLSTAVHVRIYVSVDESFTAFLDSEAIMADVQTEIGYTVMSTYEVTLQAGTHTLAIIMRSISTPIIGDGVDAMICTLAEIDSSGNPVSFIFHSDASWDLHRASENNRPGWSPGDIIETLSNEAADRGILSASAVAFDFTEVLDSEGVPWDRQEEKAWPIGVTGTQIMADLATKATFDLKPSMTLQAFRSQGEDRTGDDFCPTLLPGVNLISYTWQGIPIVATRVLVYTNEGWQMLADSDAETEYSPRESYVESGSSVSLKQGKTVGQAALNDLSREYHTYTAEFIATPGCTPYRDFFKGDKIWGLNYLGQKQKVRVLSIGGAIPDAGGLVRWNMELKGLGTYG